MNLDKLDESRSEEGTEQKHLETEDSFSSIEIARMVDLHQLESIEENVQTIPEDAEDTEVEQRSDDVTKVEQAPPGSQESLLRPRTTGIVPTSSGTARFIRTPGTFLDESQYSTSSNDTDEDSDDEDRVLITEVKGQEPVESVEAVESWKAERAAAEAPVVQPDSDDCDTDLDIDDPVPEFDPTGRTHYKNICDEMGVVPVSYFSRHLTDSSITMRYHGLGSQGTKAIAAVLKDNITVEKLNLSGNWMEGEGALHMANLIMENDNITDLNLSDNHLGADGAYHITKMLVVNIGLKCLDVSGNNFGDREAVLFAEALEETKNLKELRLSRNTFGEKAGEILGPAIGQNDVLEHLDLSWNQIRGNGALAVAKGLKDNMRLKTCNLSWNGFGPAGGVALASAIAINECLVELNISGNRLDANSANLIGQAFNRNEEMKTLRMGNNPIATVGCIAVAKAVNMSEVATLYCLDLTDIPVEYEFLRVVAEIQKKRSFKVIHGPVLRSGNTAQDIGKPATDLRNSKDPLVVLRQHVVVNDTRILDILRNYDVDNTCSVTPEQFTAALQEIGVPYTRQQIEDIANKLDKTAEGNIYYGDLVKDFQLSSHLQNGEPKEQ